MGEQPDPLGVLASTRAVVEQASEISINGPAAQTVAERIAARHIPPPVWDERLHWRGTDQQTANYILALDALNFCFWGEPRWQVEFEGSQLNGYAALAAALTIALRAGTPLYDARYLATLEARQLSEILDGEHRIPLLEERAANLREIGQGLLDHYDGQFGRAIGRADRSAPELVRLIVAAFPSFRDVARYRGREVRFYKRAQILVSDLYGVFDGQGLGAFRDLNQLTAFADYKVPQVLQRLNVLRYSGALSERLSRRVAIPAGSETEIEIRAATIWAVEEIRQRIARLGGDVPAVRIDWALWELGQTLPDGTLPYHRARTIYY